MQYSAGDEFIFDSTLLELQMFHYSMQSDLFLEAEIYSLINFDSLSNIKEKLPVVAANMIELKSYPSKIREFLLLKNLNYWVDFQGVTGEVDSLYTSYKEGFSDSDLMGLLAEKFQSLNLLKPGMEAPNIEGTLADGSPFSLEELWGKTVFVDVWATWCALCRRELPYLEKIKDEFANQDNIVFLNVSVDNNMDAWEQFIGKDGGLQGININKDGSIYRQYNIVGVPKYILIDRDGKIFSYDAERPSSGNLSDQIRRCVEG